MGPGGSDMRALAVFLQSPDVNLPGITVVIGAGWRDEEASTRCACSNCWGERIFAFIRAQPTRFGGLASGRVLPARCTEELFGRRVARRQWTAFARLPRAIHRVNQPMKTRPIP